MRLLKCAILLFAIPVSGNAIAGLPWQEYDQQLEENRKIAQLDTGSMFGDKIDLYSGALSFSVSDISLPGNNSLPVELKRSYTVLDGAPRAGSFGTWELDIPRIHAVFSSEWGHPNWCSRNAPASTPNGVSADEYWTGHHAELPGGGELLLVKSGRPQPSTGGPWRWLTAGETHFSCLAAIKNGTGEGFLAIDKNGTRYWLDWAARYAYQSYTKINLAVPVKTTIGRSKYVLYASRIEDRFGNWVTYTYSNAANQAVRLDRIDASDGRRITLGYTNGYITSASDGTHTWSYGYSGAALTLVTLPDGSQWKMDGSNLKPIQWSQGDYAHLNCETPEVPISGGGSLSITHPSGAVGTFSMGVGWAGITNVPLFCANWATPGSPQNNESDDYPVFPFKWATLVVTEKTVQGAGVPLLRWKYQLSSSSSWQYAPDSNNQPVCRSLTCADPICTSDSCAGKRIMAITRPDLVVERYVFGNSYRYNEGKLLTHEVVSGSAVSRSTRSTYHYGAATIGASSRGRGMGWAVEHTRPLVKREIIQDGVNFKWEVAKDCASAYCLDAFLRPTKVVKGSVVTP